MGGMHANERRTRPEPGAAAAGTATIQFCTHRPSAVPTVRKGGLEPPQTYVRRHLNHEWRNEFVGLGRIAIPSEPIVGAGLCNVCVNSSYPRSLAKTTEAYTADVRRTPIPIRTAKAHGRPTWRRP